MNANPDQRPTAGELHDILDFWDYCVRFGTYQEEEKFGYKGKEVKAMFEEADKEIPNISTSYEKNPDAVYTSRLFAFNNLSKPINSTIIASYIDEESSEGSVFKYSCQIIKIINPVITNFVVILIDCQDSQLHDLELS